MNFALIEARNEAEELHKSPQCPRKSNGRKIGIMELTKTIWEGKGYESLGKSSQNLRYQYANIMKTDLNKNTMRNELQQQCANEPERTEQSVNEPERNSNNTQQTEQRTIGIRTNNDQQAPRETNISTTQEQHHNQDSTQEPHLPNKYATLAQNARAMFQQIKQQGPGTWSERTQTTFTKKCPNSEDTQALNEIFKTLITTKPETDPSTYLWEANSAIYSLAVAWKNNTGKKQQQHNNITKGKQQKPKWQQRIENEIGILRKKTVANNRGITKDII